MTERKYVIRPEFAKEVRNTQELWEEMIRVKNSFRSFLNHWHFLDQDTGRDRILGEVLWPAQEEFVSVAEQHNWVFFLKARQLGETTIACAFDGWVARWRDINGRVHVFSKRDEEAVELLDRVKYGLERLPDWMTLPAKRNTTHEYVLDGDGRDMITDEYVSDRRMIKAYPADKNPARGATCTHAHLDEWTFMGDPRRVWQAVEANSSGSVHFVTTSEGPTNYTSHFWRKCMAGDVKDRQMRPVYACFISALMRPDRDPAYIAAKKAEDPMAGAWEYALTWEEALSAGGDTLFRSADVDTCGTDFRGLSEPKLGRKYAKGCDVGRHKDACVITVLDVTEDVFDVVFYKRLREATYPEIQRELEHVHRQYRGPIKIEKNAAGEAVIENLNFGIEEQKEAKFVTSQASKARILSQLNLQIQNEMIRWDPLECSQLDSEVRGYQLPDDNIVQDSVISLCLALEAAPQAYTVGKVGNVTGW
jgi:hypothetical protein